MKLNEKQKRFIDEYLLDLNATQAAIRAGYSKRSAQVHSSRLLSNPMVQAVIAERQGRRATRLEITADRIEQELARIAYADMRKYAQWGPTAAAAQSVAEAAEANRGLDFMQQTPPAGVMLLSSEELTDDDAAAVREVTETAMPGGGLKYGIKLHDKLKALELLGKRHGMWVEKHEHKHSLTTTDLIKLAIGGKNETDDE